MYKKYMGRQKMLPFQIHKETFSLFPFVTIVDLHSMQYVVFNLLPVFKKNGLGKWMRLIDSATKHERGQCNQQLPSPFPSHTFKRNRKSLFFCMKVLTVDSIFFPPIFSIGNKHL